MVTLVMTSMVILSVFRIFGSTKDTYQRGTENIDGQQNARAALNWLARELRTAKGFSFISPGEVTFLTDTHVPNQIRTFKRDAQDQDGDGDLSELLLIRNPSDAGTPGVYVDEIAVGLDSLLFVYRDGNGDPTPSRAAVKEVEVFIFATGNSMREDDVEERHGAREVGMSTRVRCRNVGKSVPTLGDEIAPAAPNGLTVAFGCGTATLMWNANSETDLAGYFLVYSRNASGPPYSGTGANQGPSPIFVGGVTTYTLTGLDLDSNYSFNVQAVDAADNESPFGEEVTGRPEDDVAPPTPSNLAARVVGNDSIYLSWSASSAWDVTSYWVQWYPAGNPSQVVGQSTSGTSITLTNLLEDEVYHCSVSASDDCGNSSALSSEITITMIPCDRDTEFPEAPAEVDAAAGDEFVRLVWTPVQDNDVVGYQVYFQEASGLSGSTLLVGNVDSYSVYGLENGTTYEFQVAAVDGCSHLSGYSALLAATPYNCADNMSPPEIPANLTVVDLGVGDKVKLSWTAGSEGDVLGYKVAWGTNPSLGSGTADVGNTVFHTIGGLFAGTTYFFSVSSYDVCGNQSAQATPVAAVPTWGCLCPPEIAITSPANLSAVYGTVDWWADAVPCSTAMIEEVEFLIDGQTEYVDYTSPYKFGDFGGGWDTSFENDGPHVLIAIATDNSGCETADTVNVYLDNAGVGAACVGLVEESEPSLTGAFEQIVELSAVNLSAVASYRIDRVLLAWENPAIAIAALTIDDSPVWSGLGESGDTLALQSSETIPAGQDFVLAIEFGNNPPSSPPSLDLEGVELSILFLGAPHACGPYAAAVPVQCVPGVSIYSVNSSAPYNVWGEPHVGNQYYTDRTYTLTSLPAELDGSILVRTPNADKNKGGSHELKLQFDRDMTVYIAYDPRGTPPNWIRNVFTNTGLTIGVTDSGTSTLGLWRADLSAGIQTFKGNKASGWGGGVNTNYVIFVKCRETGDTT
jgi:hypothetical protein